MIPALIGAGIAGAGLIGSLLQKQPKAPDISGELAQIGALFAAQREAARQAINQTYQEERGSQAAGLAARGVYRSPVAQNTFGKLDQGRIQAIGQSEGQLAGQEANVRASLLAQLLGYDVNAKQNQAQGRAAIFGQLGGLGSGLLFSGLMGNNRNVPPPPTSIPYSQYQGPAQMGNPYYPGLFNNLLSNDPNVQSLNRVYGLR